MADLRIFKPTKTAMQSGYVGTKLWCAEFSPLIRPKRDPLTGWTGSLDTHKQVRLFFETKEQAVAWAKSEKYSFVVENPKLRRVKPKSYAANFATDRALPWTH